MSAACDTLLPAAGPAVIDAGLGKWANTGGQLGGAAEQTTHSNSAPSMGITCVILYVWAICSPFMGECE